MDTGLIAAVATFRVFSSRASTSPNLTTPDLPPSRQDRMATTPVCEGPLLLSKLATNEITYLQVNNFTRAIMPRSRIWRVSESEIVIPATSSNYWLITLKGSPRSIEKFTRVISGLCRYERFYEKEILMRLTLLKSRRMETASMFHLPHPLRARMCSMLVRQ